MSITFIKFLQKNQTLIRSNVKHHGFDPQGYLDGRVFNKLPFYPQVEQLINKSIFFLENGTLNDWLDIVLAQALSDLFDDLGNLNPGILEVLFADTTAVKDISKIKLPLLNAYLVEIICSPASILVGNAGLQQKFGDKKWLHSELGDVEAPVYYGAKTQEMSQYLFKQEINQEFIKICQNKPAVITLKQQQQEQKEIADTACKEYQRHLLREIEKHYPVASNKLDYKFKNFPAALGERELPSKLSFKDSAEGDVANSSLKLAIKKYNLVGEMRAELHKKHVSLAEQLNNFAGKLNQSENHDLLNQNRDSAAMKFLKAIGFMVSMVVSKVNTGTFKFWKPHSQVFEEHLKQDILPAIAVVPRAT